MQKKSSLVEIERDSVDLPSARSSSPSSPSSPSSSSSFFNIHWFAPRVLTIIYIVILFVWIFQAEGGLGFVELSLFGWHALLMSLFVVLFTQEALLSFTAPLVSGPVRQERPSLEKWFHVTCHVLGIIFAMLGITAIVYYKNLSPQPPAFPFYSVFSPHSWLGIVVLILWGLQMCGGIYVHIINSSALKIPSKVHKFLGKVIYVGGLATCALGLQDMQSSDLASSVPVEGMTDEMMNMAGNNTGGYLPNSAEAQYSCACTILLLFIGIATFVPIVFKPKKSKNNTL